MLFAQCLQTVKPRSRHSFVTFGIDCKIDLFESTKLKDDSAKEIMKPSPRNCQSENETKMKVRRNYVKHLKGSIRSSPLNCDQR